MQFEIKTEIEIEASPEAVWRVLTDTASWDLWNPTLLRFRGRLAPGETIFFKVAMGPWLLPISARVEEATPGRELRWTGPAGDGPRRFAHGTHYFRLLPQGEGNVRFVHGEAFGGLLVPPPLSAITREMTRRYQAFNQALKARAEGLPNGA